MTVPYTAHTARTMERTFYKLDIGGIVYLVDPNATAYTYDLSNPIEIGKIIWTDAKAQPRLERRRDWQEVLAAKLANAPGYVTPNTNAG